MSDERQVRVSTFELNKAEMAVRILEALHGVHRPHPDPVTSLKILDQNKDANALGLRALRAADAVCDYIIEQLNETAPVIVHDERKDKG